MSDKFAFWNTMDSTHKVTFVLLMVVTVSFPVFLLALMNPKLPIFSRASNPATPPDIVDYCVEMPGNLVDNYNFESGKSNWNFQKGSDGKFTAVDDTYSCLKVAQVAMAKNAKAQLSQSGILLEPNTTYEVSFAAKASEARNINVFVHRHSKPYTNYGLSYTANLTPEWKTFTTTFTTPAAVDSNSRLRFWFAGRKGDTYWIDNVVVKEVDKVSFMTDLAGLASDSLYVEQGENILPILNTDKVNSDGSEGDFGNSVYLNFISTINNKSVSVSFNFRRQYDVTWYLNTLTTQIVNQPLVHYETTPLNWQNNKLINGTLHELGTITFNSTSQPGTKLVCENCQIGAFLKESYTLTPTPTPVASKRVFVTSTTYNGNLGGLSGADAKCQERADSANLGGIWKAWISDSSETADYRLKHHSVSILRMDGLKVADNWGDLIDGLLDNPIVVDEFGYIHTEESQGLRGVWTNTASSGNWFVPPQGWNFSSTACMSWTSNVAGSNIVGVYGNPFSTLANGWTSSTYASCNIDFMHLYCFEQ